MAFEDVRDNLKEQLRQISSNVQESSAYINLKEKYQGYSPTAQKGILAGVVALSFLLIMAVPYMFYSGSQTSMEDFESRRTLVRDLFRATREAGSLPPPPPPISSSDLQNNARNLLNGARLQAEQITGVAETPVTVTGIPKTVEQAGILVSLSKLNLRQIVQIGHELQNIHPMARMNGLEIKANVTDPKYYDAAFKIVAFSAKPEATPKPSRSKR